MLLKTRGKAYNINDHLVGRVTRDYSSIDSDTIYLSDESSPIIEDIYSKAIATLSTSRELKLGLKDKAVLGVSTLDHLYEGDLVSISSDGIVNTLFRVNSSHNTLLVTERCNSNCLMCSQPPRDRDDIPVIHEIHRKLIPLIPKECHQLGISGGEPTLLGDRFFELLSMLKVQLPNTEIHVLTNGRSFAWNTMAQKLASLEYDKVMLGVPLYSDYYRSHDYIVQAKDAFNQTVLGLHNLARYEIRVEIRVVLHKQTIPRLRQLSRFIYKNLPFVEHVAFMGLEYVGYTPFNIDKLWIDPFDYQEELEEATCYLSSKGLQVSIYNTPLCLLPESTWEFARKSISDWKNDYLPECQNCAKLGECGGFFTWNLKKHSEHIKPFSLA